MNDAEPQSPCISVCLPEPQSPCISVCLLDEGDICVGCCRSADEIGR
jgi:predicted Fe-S protein YdhL (DUF1289 family)